MGDTIKKTGIRVQAFACAALAFLALVNAAVLIWMSGKIKKKLLRNVGIASLFIALAGVILVSVVSGETAITIATVVILLVFFIPIPFILISLKDFVSCQTLLMFVEKHHINVQTIEEDDFSNIKVYPDKLTEKNSQRLFGNKWEAVLKIIQYKENEQRIAKENEKIEKIARQKEEEAKKAEMKRAKEEQAKAEEIRLRAEAEARKAEQAKEKELMLQAEAEARKIEIIKAEAEQAKAEALKLQAEAEAKKIEIQRAEAEQAKAEVLKLQAEAEARKVEMKRAEAEQAKAEAEAQKLQAEAEMKKLELEKEKNKESRYVKKSAENIQKVDINLCTEQELSLIEGIGIILSKKAIRIRKEKGRFQSVAEFMQEVGIRESNRAMVEKYLICEERETVIENNVKRHGRKIDL